VRLLAGVADPGDPLVIADCLGLAELRIKADELRRDPRSDPLAIVRLEGLIDRRMRRLGVGFGRKREHAVELRPAPYKPGPPEDEAA
jgi:hypothetical protein